MGVCKDLGRRCLPVNIRVAAPGGEQFAAEITRRARADVAEMFKLRRVENPEFGFDCVAGGAGAALFAYTFPWATGKASMRDKKRGFIMYQSKEKIQTVVLLLADLICFVISYFGGGYLWLVLYRNVSVQNMKSELMDSFGIVLVIYMLILLFSDLRRIFIRRNLARDFWAALEASVIMIFVTALTIFCSITMRMPPEAYISVSQG